MVGFKDEGDFNNKPMFRKKEIICSVILSFRKRLKIKINQTNAPKKKLPEKYYYGENIFLERIKRKYE